MGKGELYMELMDFMDETTRKNIIKELSRSFDGLGIDIEDIIIDINAKAVNLKICLCSNKF